MAFKLRLWSFLVALEFCQMAFKSLGFCISFVLRKDLFTIFSFYISFALIGDLFTVFIRIHRYSRFEDINSRLNLIHSGWTSFLRRFWLVSGYNWCIASSTIHDDWLSSVTTGYVEPDSTASLPFIEGTYIFTVFLNSDWLHRVEAFDWWRRWTWTMIERTQERNNNLGSLH